MWSTLARPVLGLLFIAGAACSSPLEEYVCQQDSDCGGLAGLAQCEESKHCSFIDPSCLESGYRFGDSSGTESGVCVGDDEAVVPADAGPGSTGTRPVAFIDILAFDNCSTAVVASGADSEAFEGATLTTYEWTLRNSSGGLIDTFAGRPSDKLPLGLHRLSGDFLQPHVNFPPYHGAVSMRAIVDGGIRGRIFQKDLVFGANALQQKFQIFFALGLEGDVDTSIGTDVTASLVSGDAEIIIEQTFSGQSGRFVGHQAEFDLSTVPGSSNLEDVRLEFRFAGVGLRWLDNLALVNTASGNVVTANRSAENGSDGPWKLGDGISDVNGLVVRGIEAGLLEDEDYALQLRVTDSNGGSSDVVEVLVSGGDCVPSF